MKNLSEYHVDPEITAQQEAITGQFSVHIIFLSLDGVLNWISDILVDHARSLYTNQY